MPFKMGAASPRLMPRRMQGSARGWVGARHAGGLSRSHLVLLAYLTLMGAAFLPVFEGYDPLREGITSRRAYEIGLMGLGTALLASYVAFRATPSLRYAKSEIHVLVGFALLAFASSLWSLSPVLTMVKAGQLIVIAFGAALLVPLSRRHPRVLRDLPYLIALSVLGLVSVYLGVNYLVWGTAVPYVEIENGPVRLLLGYAHPLVSGNLAVLGVIGLLASNRGIPAKALLAAPLIGVLLATNARASMVGLLVALACMSLLNPDPVGRRRLVAALAIAYASYLTLTLAGVSMAALAESFEKYSRWESIQGLSGRVELWSYTLGRILDRPMLGVGYEAGRYVLLQYAPWAATAHNSFLDIAVGTGILGLLLLFLFSIELLRTIRWTRDALLMGVAAQTYVYGMTSMALFVPSFGMLVLILSITRAALLARAR